MHVNTSQKITLAATFGLVVFWSALLLTKTTDGTYNYLFSFLMSVLPLVGGLVAMVKSPKWTGNTRRGMFLLGLGLVFWGCGGMIWAYYNFFQGVAAPYPSLADLGYAPSVFFYCAGIVYLARAAGADFGLKNRSAKFFIFLAPIIIFVLSYYLLVVIARQGVLVTSGDPFLKTVFDLAYPVGDFISLTLAVVISGLSFKFLVKEYRAAIIALLIGLVIMFAADSIFSYTTTLGTYYNADFGDLLFALGMATLTFGVLGFAGSRSKAR